MLPQIKINYQLKIIEVLEDGFRAVLPDDKRYINIIKDTKVLKDHSFEKEDTINITLELVDKKKEDIIELNKVEYYIGVMYTTSNGVFTKTYNEKENPFKSFLWYESRGMITSKVLENNPFEVGDLIKVTIRRMKNE